MSESQYIDILWKVIYVLGGIVSVLVAVIWGHIRKDMQLRVELQRCKDALGLNGRERR